MNSELFKSPYTVVHSEAINNRPVRYPMPLDEDKHPIIYYSGDQNIMIPVNNNHNMMNNNMQFINPCNLPPHAALFKRNP